MKKIYFLSTCDTCKRILKELNPSNNFLRQDVKKEGLTLEELEHLYQLSGSYESLFNKRAQLYKQRDLKNKNLQEVDFKNLLLDHYTFLKRPVIINQNKIFIWNSKKTVESAKKSIA